MLPRHIGLESFAVAYTVFCNYEPKAMMYFSCDEQTAYFFEPPGVHACTSITHNNNDTCMNLYMRSRCVSRVIEWNTIYTDVFYGTPRRIQPKSLYAERVGYTFVFNAERTKRVYVFQLRLLCSVEVFYYGCRRAIFYFCF